MSLSSLMTVFCVIVAIYPLIMFGMYVSQRALLYHPDQTVVLPEEIQATRTERVDWKSHDGLDIPVWVRHPFSEGNESKPFYILYFHGNAGEVSWRYKRLRSIFERGYGAILPSYRYNAVPSGAPSETALKEDAIALYDQALSRLGLTNDQVILYGESLGSGIALFLASQGKGRAVILDGAYPSIMEVAQEKYWWLPVEYLLKDKFNTLAILPGLTQPILQMHGEKDRLIPKELAYKIYQARPDLVDWRVITGAGHSDLYDFGAARIVSDFLKTLR